MEKLFLRAFLSYNKLDIIDQKNVVVPVFLPEFRGGNIIFIPDRIDQFVGELLAGHVKNLGFLVVFQHKMADGMHQVRLAKSHAAVNKKRIVDLPRRFRHG